MVLAGLWAALAGAQPALVDRVAWMPEPLSGDELRPHGVDVDGWGNVWIATDGGVVRWDGERTVRFRIAGDGPQSAWSLRAHHDLVVAGRFNRELVELRDGAMHPVLGSDGQPIASEKYLVDDSGLWVFETGFGLRLRTAAGDWRPFPIDDLGEARGLALTTAPDGGVVLGTYDHGLWEIRPDGTHRHTVERGRVWDTAFYADGRMIALIDRGPVLIEPDGRTREVGFHAMTSDEVEVGDHRRYVPITVVVAEGTALYGSEQHLDQLLDDGSVVRTLADRSVGLQGVGDLTLDREGSVWFHSRRGVGRLVEPRTWLWTKGLGLASDQLRTATADGDRLWVTTYGGYSVLEPRGGTFEVRTLQGVEGAEPVCVDGAGGAWTFAHLGSWSGPRGWLRLDLDPPELVLPVDDLGKCAATRDGRVWLVDAARAVEIGADGERRRELAGPPISRVTAAFEASDGRLFAAGGTRICVAGEPWACEDLPQRVGPNLGGLLEPSPGRVWAITEGDGIWALNGTWEPDGSLQRDGWAPPPLGVSARGGLWSGPDTARVELDDGSWRPVEVLGEAVGLTRERVLEVVETDAGDLWVVTHRTVGRVPAEARDPDLSAPDVVWSSFAIDGQAVSPGSEVHLPAASPPVELAFSARSARSPHALRYRYRASDGRWSTGFSEPVLRFAGLQAGTHRIEVAASLDGTTWSAAPATVSIRVDRPWYRQPWFLMLVVVVVGVVAAGIQRARLAARLRRTELQSRIAMDLHDELGAGLGSIRILAGMASVRAEKRGQSPELTRRIEANAADLASALTDIVWALRPSSDSLDALALYMADRGRDLFAGHPTRFRVSLPDPLPKVRMSLVVSRHAQLILLEALHNVAKHAEADSVQLSLGRSGGRWAFTVVDDGVGIAGATEPRPGGGSGLDAMHRRAQAMGADVRVQSRSGRTEITLTLPSDLQRG